MAGAGVDEVGSAVDVDASAAGTLVSIDNGSISGFEADPAATKFDDVDCSGFAFSLAVLAAGAVSDMMEELSMGGRE